MVGGPLNTLLSHLGSLRGGALGVTFESLLGHLYSFWVSVELGARPLPNSRHLYPPSPLPPPPSPPLPPRVTPPRSPGRILDAQIAKAEEFGMSLETRETEPFWRDVAGFCPDIPEAPEKFEKIKFVFNFGFLNFKIAMAAMSKRSEIARF